MATGGGEITDCPPSEKKAVADESLKQAELEKQRAMDEKKAAEKVSNLHLHVWSNQHKKHALYRPLTQIFRPITYMIIE